MLYAGFKMVHLLSMVVWVGGMFFTLTCLRPSLAVLDAPARPTLMLAVLGRFFKAVNVAIGLMLVSGVAMLWRSGWRVDLPPSWYVMIVLGLVMMGVFGHIGGTLFGRLRSAAEARDAPAGAAALAAIRRAVTVNLVLGVVVIVAMKLGGS